MNTTSPQVEPAVSLLSRSFFNVIDGKTVTSPTTYNIINPTTRQVVARVPDTTPEQLDEAVLAARAAFPSWKAKTWGERAEVLRSIANLLEDEQLVTDLARMLTLEMGKPLFLAKHEIMMSASWIKGIANLSLESPISIKEDERSKVFSRYIPVGVGAGIIPWHFPLGMLAWKLAPALLTGNTLILKPSPYAPLAALTFVAKVQERLPRGVLSILSGGADLGKLIASHPGIDIISITGSIPSGKDVLVKSVDTLKRVTLELGGNDPCIVLPDADPLKAAPTILRGTFLNNGQICTVAKRIYVHESIYDQFLENFVEAAKSMTVGDPLDSTTKVGPVCNEYQYDVVHSLIDDCKANGYRFALGGEVDPNSPGYFIPLTVIDNPPDDSRIVKEEPFGPIVPILKWQDEDDVIRRANDSKHGLGASVWGKDQIALERIGSQLEAGTVWINNANHFDPLRPYGGHKQSGLGLEHGIEGLKQWCNHQGFSIKKVADI